MTQRKPINYDGNMQGKISIIVPDKGRINDVLKVLLSVVSSSKGGVMGLFDKMKQGAQDRLDDAHAKLSSSIGTQNQQQAYPQQTYQQQVYQPQIAVCPSCMTPLDPPNAKFCGKCGAKIEPPAQTPMTPADQRQYDKRLRTIAQLDAEIAQKRNQIITFDDAILMQEFGLYEPRYDFANSSQYKDRLKLVRDQQKQMIRNKTAYTGNMDWRVNNSKSEGRKMVSDVQKLLMRSFNDEADDTIRKVKHSNFDASRDRIFKSANSINNLGRTWDIRITIQYVNLKIDELHLAYEFAVAKEREREELRELREREREEAKLRKEIEEQRKKLNKEKTQYERALADLEKQLANCSDDERSALEAKKAELTANIAEVDKGIENVDYREANQRAGYVYIISNIGSFGENVYKIGMTRRLEPMERIYELSDASVPFNFDVHALIFTDDAPGLEAALHNYFAKRKVNLVNPRREFFRCTLDEIMQAVRMNFDKTVEFIEIPEAEQFRTSEAMRQSGIFE